ncbi:DUF3592 domain-containing protein [Streptomyces sp. NPDC056632]|uniref:DUF3592 domain-containing protein n=1 Tax=Streptomyces sp. NPDC056632 TaxID=3345884 RepID=UPI0036846BF1
MSPSTVLWLLASAFTPAGALVAAAAHHRIRQIRRLIRQGKSAEGMVVRLEPTKLEGHGSDHTITIRSSGTTVYYPVIAWATADGQAMETRTDIARPLNRTLPPGTRVEVRYDPAKPSHWTLPTEKATMWWLAVALGGLFVLIGAGFLAGALVFGR